MPRPIHAARREYPKLARGRDVKPSPAALAKDWLHHHDALWVEEWSCFVLRRKGEPAYRVIDGERFARALSRWCDLHFPAQRVTQAFCRDAAWCAASLAHPSHVLDEAPTRHAAFADCLLDLYTMEPVPLGTAPTVIGFDSSLADVMAAKSPMWDEYLRTAFVADDGVTESPALVASFRETCGTLLLSSRAVSCAVFLYGPTAGNGKSTCLDVFRGVFGKEMTSALSLSSIVENRFASAHLLGKLFNFCGEVGTKYARHDLFKSIVTGDLIPAERKFGSSFEFVPEVRMFFAVNSVPTFEGMDNGLMRRMRMYPMRADFRGRKGKDGLAKRIVREERDGVLRWVIGGARALRDNGYAFSDAANAAIAETMERFERESSAVMRFVADRGWRHMPSCEPVPVARVFADYVRWCEEVKCKVANENTFAAEFVRVTRCGERFDHRHAVTENGVVRRAVLKSLRVAVVDVHPTETPTLPLPVTDCAGCLEGRGVCMAHGF